jgi:hypothetical protein
LNAGEEFGLFWKCASKICDFCKKYKFLDDKNQKSVSIDYQSVSSKNTGKTLFEFWGIFLIFFLGLKVLKLG